MLTIFNQRDLYLSSQKPQVTLAVLSAMCETNQSLNLLHAGLYFWVCLFGNSHWAPCCEVSNGPLSSMLPPIRRDTCTHWHRLHLTTHSPAHTLHEVDCFYTLSCWLTNIAYWTRVYLSVCGLQNRNHSIVSVAAALLPSSMEEHYWKSH